MKEILTAMIIWLGANSNLDTNHDVPLVIFLPQDQLNHMYYKDSAHDGNKLHGLYDRDKDTIFLPDTWDRRRPWDLGVLLHEMMHYLQDQNEIKFSCVQEMERDVWPTQRKYLREVHDYEWEYDELWYWMVSNCTNGY